MAGIAGYVWHTANRPRILEMYIFDLKSSQAVFIRTPNDRRILINGGANSDIIRQLTKILPFYSRRIDAIIATDADGKNVSGLIDVMNRYSVNKVIIPEISLESLGLSTTTDQIYSVFIDAIKNKNIHVKEVRAGDRVIFDANNSVYADILFPISRELFKYSKASPPQLVTRISFGSNSIMLLNDATTKIQKFIALGMMNASVTMPTGRQAPVEAATSVDLAKPTKTLRRAEEGAGTDTLIVFNNASPDNLATELMNELRPEYLIYLKSLSSSSSKSATSKNKKVDPLFYLLDDHRFNMKEKGIVKIVSDGSELKVEN
jgi:hypothetical protein